MANNANNIRGKSRIILENLNYLAKTSVLTTEEYKELLCLYQKALQTGVESSAYQKFVFYCECFLTGKGNTAKETLRLIDSRKGA